MAAKRLVRLLAVFVALALAAVLPASAGAAPPSTLGAPGAGDPYFPLSGNGGFHVVHYDLHVSYTPRTGHLDGAATLSARTTQRLSRFDLDLSGLSVSSVRVDGSAARWVRHGQELVVTPAHTMRGGARFTVQVRYAGTPHYVTDPDGSPDGWIRTDTGAFVGSEPQGSMTWFPGNAHPVDKSAYDVTVTVPTGYVAVGNGQLVLQRAAHGRTTFHWRERQPMAAYLATASIARFQVQTYATHGLPVYIAVDPREAAKARPVLAQLPQIIAWERGVFGPSPFTSVGAIVEHAPRVGYALETQTRPVFDRAPDSFTLVHELAHQWYGDSVSLTSWRDIWLNEGFATYAEWLWAEHTGQQTARQIFLAEYARPASDGIWARPVADPGSGAHIFASPVYDRGAMVLEKLRERVGNTAFFAILREWAAQHRYGHGTTAQFTALATRVSHRNLSGLFHTWLFTAGKPAHP